VKIYDLERKEASWQAALLGIRVSHRYVELHLENDTHRNNALNKVKHKFSTNYRSMRKYQTKPMDFDDWQV